MIDRSQQDVQSAWPEDGPPLVSVCCITFNHADVVSQALDSILAQETDFRFELLVRDDCSTDGTADVIREYVARFPSIIFPVFEQRNRYREGVRPLPVLYRLAKGRYIALCEGDDFWIDPTKLQRQVDFLQAHDEVSMVFENARVDVYDRNGALLSSQPFNEGLKPGFIEPRDLLGDKRITPTASVMFRNVDVAAFLEDKADFPFGDTPAFLYLSRFGKLHYSDIVSSVYRRRSTGMVESSFASPELTPRFVRYYRFIQAYFPEYELRDLVRQRLSDRYHEQHKYFLSTGNLWGVFHSLWRSFVYSPKNFSRHLRAYFAARLGRKRGRNSV